MSTPASSEPCWTGLVKGARCHRGGIGCALHHVGDPPELRSVPAINLFPWDPMEAVRAEAEAYASHLRCANRYLLAGARAMAAIKVRGRRARRRAMAAVPSRPDALDLETEAAKISDTVAVYTGDQSLPVGQTFDRLEGRSAP